MNATSTSLAGSAGSVNLPSTVFTLVTRASRGLLVDGVEQSLVDVDRVDRAARSDGFGERTFEDPGAGADVRHDHPGLEAQPGDGFIDLQVLHPGRRVEGLEPFLG